MGMIIGFTNLEENIAEGNRFISIMEITQILILEFE
jgi:hypothetical protein